MSSFKNIQVVDDALNAVNRIYRATEEEFDFIFPDDADVEFAEPLWHRIQEAGIEQLMTNIWARPVPKSKVKGIHGTLYTKGFEYMEQFLSSRRYADLHSSDVPHEMPATQSEKKCEENIKAAAPFTKNVQVIRASELQLFPIYQMTEAEFLTIFPSAPQDIEFEIDVVARLGEPQAIKFLNSCLSRPIPKAMAMGIHGTFYCRGFEDRMEYFPNKKESDVD